MAIRASHVGRNPTVPIVSLTTTLTTGLAKDSRENRGRHHRLCFNANASTFYGCRRPAGRSTFFARSRPRRLRVGVARARKRRPREPPMPTGRGLAGSGAAPKDAAIAKRPGTTETTARPGPAQGSSSSRSVSRPAIDPAAANTAGSVSPLRNRRLPSHRAKFSPPG